MDEYHPDTPQHHIGILIPTTSRNRDWNKIHQTHFCNLFLKHFIDTRDRQH